MKLEKYKGIHPGIVLERELRKRALKQRPFALLLHEHPQTLNAITKGKRGLSIPLALKIEKELGLEEGTLTMLQLYYDIKKEREKQEKRIPNLSRLRKALFWDTDISHIDWERQYKAVIRRVFERGNETEKKEMMRFYGADKIQSVLEDADVRKPPHTLQKTARRRS